jgi:hypothetical protein
VAEVVRLGDVLVIGGGCYGSFYVGQLEAARAKGAVAYRRLVVVDRDPDCRIARAPADPARQLVGSDWSAFLDRWLVRGERDRLGAPDMIVPSPLMPHLMAEWLLRQAEDRWPDRAPRFVPAVDPVGTPFDRLHPSGVRYVSWADWLCPVHCVEPARCPVIRAPRSWEMGDTLREWTLEHERRVRTVGPALFTCRHVVYGVGMYPAAAAFEALALLESLGAETGEGELVVGSVSACHGAVAVLRLDSRHRAH